MNTETANRIDNMLYDSGLFPLKSEKLNQLGSFDFSDDIILVTGAAGTIGSGLTRLLVNSKYRKLILVDVAESPLYELIKELEFEDFNHVDFILLDVTDEKSLKHLFKTYNPTIIFHAAAYKHVPIMESNPYKAVELNILGTKLLADLANQSNVKKFVFISTDKAVNPIGIMGISKRIGENYMHFINKNSTTHFITTRFGNIFGSNGSIIPLFKRQIEFGKPITITDKSITRLFISKQKACNLILKLASKKNFDYDLYTLNMGFPIKIIDIIERLISFYDIILKTPEIRIIGLRPGEKLYEDIISENESLVTTNDIDILAIKKLNSFSYKNIDFIELKNISPNTPHHEIKNILSKYI
ncbi:SDR family NAD(P)-dependent oxidoreductase [uncultured Algibacter sp.]|uniref:SDR family NAD(P)-dependent oxidoreductase n=1 Tax=uncultured Algibacter sp. TaxID=298659 RepID=UPI0026243989|nr:SDR family NAD(P)-dependent oxidoreductase [uncultured Algibacter sp.]